MTPDDPLARRPQYLTPSGSILRRTDVLAVIEPAGKASLPAIFGTAADVGGSSAAVRPRAAAVGDKAARPFLKFKYLAHALLDVFAALFGIVFIVLYLAAVAGAVFIILFEVL